jgi:signal peptidase II
MAIAALVVAFDQATKQWLASALGPGASQFRTSFGAPWLALEYSENRGAAFGMLPGAAPFLTLAAIAIVVALLVQYLKEPRPAMLQTIAVAAIIGGAIGNLVDRIRLGYVVDFISIGPWPNFNVADSAITLGVILLVWRWWPSGAGDPLHQVGEERA